MDLKDKIFGAIYGCAIGDALGLATEFMTREEVAFRYPKGVHGYTDIYRDAHRCQWEPGEWTADTELILCILEEALEVGALNAVQMAKTLKNCAAKGNIEMPAQYRFIFKHPDYETNPIKVAEEVWRQMGGNRASNEAASRSVIAGFFSPDPVNRGKDVCRVTHVDPLCIGSSAVLAQMAHDLMWNDKVTDIQDLIKIAEEVDERIVPFINWSKEPTLSVLDLDDPKTCWYTRKTMASGLWAVWNCDNAKQALDALIAEGGDSGINASTALTLLGARDGFKSLPQNLVEGLKNRERLDNVAERLYERFKDRNYCD